MGTLRDSSATIPLRSTTNIMTLDTCTTYIIVSSVYFKGVKMPKRMHDISFLNNFFSKHATVFVLFYLNRNRA
jgi:hypothetical protein